MAMKDANHLEYQTSLQTSSNTTFVNEGHSGAVLVTPGDVKSYRLNNGGEDIALC